MTTHPFLPSYLDRSECEQCRQPEDDPRHREFEITSKDSFVNILRFPPTISAYLESAGITSPKNT